MSDFSKDEFNKDLQLIIGVHNEVRDELYPGQDEKAHIINENTILRLSALLEAHGIDSPPTEKDQNPSSGKVAVRTLKYLRNLIIHKDHGKFITCKCSDYWLAFEIFAKEHVEIHVADGEPICLAGKEVLQPLVDGLVEWANEKYTCRGLIRDD